MNHSRATSAAHRWSGPSDRSRVPAGLSAVIALVLTAVLLAACTAAAGAPGPPSPSSGTTASRPVPSSIADLPLTDQNGHAVTLAGFRGRTLMVVPFLTLCQEMCPYDTGNLLAVQHALDRAHLSSKVVLAEVSVDPGRDTPARLAAYAHLTGAQFELLTGSADTVAALEHFFGWYAQQVPEDSPPAIDWWTQKPLTYDVDHSDGYALVDASGIMRFETAASPDYSGSVNSALSGFMSEQGRSYRTHPPAMGWTATSALGSLGWVLHQSVPAS